MRAKFIGKRYGTGYERNRVYLEYEYRGMRYEVVEDRGKGNEPFSWQHRSEQDRIDRILDAPKSRPGESAQASLDVLWAYWEGYDHVF